MGKGKTQKTMHKLQHVYGTVANTNEKTWIVKVNNVKKTMYCTSAKKLLCTETTWEVKNVSCICRYLKKKPFRYVTWRGFKTPTQEPVNFTYNSMFSESDSESDS